jgi:hypothetical protein
LTRALQIEISDHPDAAMFLFENLFATVDQYKIPDNLPDDNEAVLELKAELSEVYWLGHIIIDNAAVRENGNKYEYEKVRDQVERAFALLEKIGSLHLPEEE